MTPNETLVSIGAIHFGLQWFIKGFRRLFFVANFNKIRTVVFGRPEGGLAQNCTNGPTRLIMLRLRNL